MRLKLTYQRVSGSPVDIVVTTDATATVSDVAEEIVATDPAGRHPSLSGQQPTVSVAVPGATAFANLDPLRAIGQVQIASGHSIRVVPAAAPVAPADLGLQVSVRIDSGVERGRQLTLGEGRHNIGRDNQCDVVLNDPLVSKMHARLDIGDVVELVDLNSANGILVDGGLVPRLAVVDGQRVLLGDTALRFVVRQPHGSAMDPSRITNASIPFNRSPRVEPRFPGTAFEPPEAPGEQEKPPFPWMMMVVPVLMGLALYVQSKNPASLLFLVMSPLMMLANFYMSRQQVRRRHSAAVAKYEAQFDRLERSFATEAPIERDLRDLESPRVGVVWSAAINGDALLWTRRPEHWSFLNVRLGTGRTLSRNTVKDESRLDRGLPEFAERTLALVERYRSIDHVAIAEDPLVAGAIGVAGARESAAGFARSLLVQWCGLHSPAELVVTAITSSAQAPEFTWLKWLPHTSALQSPLVGSHLADSAATVDGLVAQLEELIDHRLEARVGESPEPWCPPLGPDLQATTEGARVGEKAERDGSVPTLPVVVVLITEDVPIDRARWVQLVERGAAAGVVPLVVAEHQERLPAACRTFVSLAGGAAGAEVHFVRHGQTVRNVVIEPIAADQALAFAKSLAPVVDASALVADSSDLPLNVPLLSLLGADMANDSAAVVDRWRQTYSLHSLPNPSRRRNRTPTLRALVGQTGADALHLDLRAQGPHALVGGTTGAGKSEFLQSWVLGMAAEYSPDRVTFLFVDYKGGAAFAECVNLPHCVGLVTDLSQHLVHRALRSLRAELRHREHLLGAKKAKDLVELEKRGDADAPPALVIVIDEFAALVGDVPEFVDGVVDVAQRGRSLGIHLIMATQRPAGVIRDNLRANTNLRVALRMADEADSSDVVGEPDAAWFDPAIPGRGLAKTGPGRLVQFQSAYAGGWSDEVEQRPATFVHELRFGAEQPWERPEEVEETAAERGPSDLVRLVGSISGAARLAGCALPRRPWLDELSTTYDLAMMGAAADHELVLGMADVPDDQAQRVLHFRPDDDGHLIIYGTGGSGKTVLLRTLAIGAAAAPESTPVEVYCLDFASGGLRMLEPLPHVGAVITGDDSERVMRLMRMLRDEIDRRARVYSAVSADSLSAYRRITGVVDEPRILVLLDGYPSFRADYEATGLRAQTYSAFQSLLTEGRQLGIHVVMTVDRPSSVPGAISSSVPRRVVLRMAEEAMYLVLDVPADVIGPDSPAGRALIDGLEAQIAVLGGSSSATDQAARIMALAGRLRAAGRRETPRVQSLPAKVPAGSMPDRVGDQPVLGVSDETLTPIGFVPSGVFLLGGGPGSGRSNALQVISDAVRRSEPATQMHYLAARRSHLQELAWHTLAVGVADAGDAARSLAPLLDASGSQRHCIVIEALSDFMSSPADAALVELIKVVKRTGHLLIAESETSTWNSSWPLYAEVKAGRRGLLLQPDASDGDTILKTTFPRAPRSEFPPGRGLFVEGGKVVRVQLPLA